MKKRKKASKSQRNSSRRDFLRKGALATAAVVAGCSPKVADVVEETPTTVPAAPPSAGNVLGANDRLTIGFVGVGGQGFNAHVRKVPSTCFRMLIRSALAQMSLPVRFSMRKRSRLCQVRALVLLVMFV